MVVIMVSCSCRPNLEVSKSVEVVLQLGLVGREGQEVGQELAIELWFVEVDDCLELQCRPIAKGTSVL